MKTPLALAIALCMIPAALAIAERAMPAVTLDLRAAPLPSALTRLQDASGLRLVFAADLVKDAEPVTLSAKDEPVDDVLLKILRPRGLEFICTADTMAAIVPQASDAGAAKMAGRSLHTIFRFLAALDAAVQQGDEVHLPGWTDAGDRALAESLADLMLSAYFCAVQRRQSPDPADLMRLFAMYDPDVRAGAGVPVAPHIEQASPVLASRWELAPALNKMLADPDPAVRAGGIFTLAIWHSQLPSVQTDRNLLADTLEHRLPIVQDVFAMGIRDPAFEVRFAAALLAILDSRVDPDLAAVSQLRSDPTAAVRGIAWVSCIQRQMRDGVPPAPADFAPAAIAEKNPILRALGVSFACITWPQEVDAANKSGLLAPVSEDPWLKLWADLIASFLQAARQPAAAEPDLRAKLMTRIVELAASGKRSHQVLAGIVGASCLRIGSPGRMDLSKLGPFADSTCLYTRFIGIIANGFAPGEEAGSRILKALRSDEEFDRLAAAIACTVAQEKNPDAPPMPGGAELDAVLLDLAKSPGIESLAAMKALSIRLPFDRLMELLQDQIGRAPHAPRAAALLQALIYPRHMPYSNDELRSQRQMVVLDALLESKDASLQTYFARLIAMRSSLKKPVILAMLVDLEPQAFIAFVTDPILSGYLYYEAYAVEAVLDRLASLFDKGNGPLALQAAKGFSVYIGSYRGIMRNEGLNGKMIALTDGVLSWCSAPGASDEKLALAIDLLDAIPDGNRGFARARIRWNDVTPGIRAAAIHVLAQTGHKTLGARVIAFLGSCWRFLDPEELAGNDPEMLAAMGGARRRVVESGRTEDQVELLTWMAGAKDDGIAQPAAAELGRLYMAGTVPAAQRRSALLGIARRPTKVTSEFAQFLMTRAADRNEPAGLRLAALPVLAGCAEQYGPIVDVLAEMVKVRDAAFDHAIGTLARGIRPELARPNGQGQPPPDWAKKAADLALAIIGDGRRSSDSKERALALYSAAAGPEAVTRIEAMALDDKQDPSVRWNAVQMVMREKPDSTLLATLAPKYATLPSGLRQVLANIAINAQKAPGAASLIVSRMKDREVGHRDGFAKRIEPPAAPELVAGLKELEQDPEIGAEVREALKRLEHNQ